MTRLHTEKVFEEAIEAALLSPEGGWQKGDAAQFSRQLALDESTLFAFLEDTQAAQWQRLEAIHRGNARTKFLERLEGIGHRWDARRAAQRYHRQRGAAQIGLF